MFRFWKKKKDVSSLPNAGKLCECTGDIAWNSSTSIENFPLGDGYHTGFIFGKCEGCGGFSGFPHSNLELAVKTTSKEGKKILLELGFTSIN
jgi:hypothetical protein